MTSQESDTIRSTQRRYGLEGGVTMAHFEKVDLEEWQREAGALIRLLSGADSAPDAEEDLRDLLAQPEGKTLEFKRDLSSLAPVLKTLTAFANTAGGTLIAGRANDGSLHG